ncbi:MAG TPA: O-sialoglycoprotein endopeptidase [Desulfitobacteriaceae bacterium]|nr:O-sialoglycoprotein endopeptidase [Desulfitobacteriaceae bacterium]
MNYLGLDTSAYTTSLAIVNEGRDLIWESQNILKVAVGETGLAQSTAFFQHVHNLTNQIPAIPRSLWETLAGIGVSCSPRPVAGSYMPVFTAGIALANALAAARQIPLFLTSHQEGHIAAGCASAKGPAAEKFLAVHLSGGTTELLLVSHTAPGRFSLELLGGTTDLHAGQFVDRVGVRLGLQFPAGRALEELALEAEPEAASLLPSAVKGFEVSFSGVESAAQRLIDQGISKSNVALAVEGCLVRTLAKLIANGMESTGLQQVLMVGGVAANKYLRSELDRRLHKQGQFYWAEPDWCRDNAIGVALLTGEGCRSSSLEE